jgi:hypothetical protein
MNPMESGTPRSARDSMMDDFITHIVALFSRLPTLSGFSVQERGTLISEREAAQLDGELSIADLTVDTWPGAPSEGLGDEIVGALLELLDEHPAARGLLRGTTFARVFH